MNYTTLLEISLALSFSIAGALLIHAVASQTLLGDEEPQPQKARVKSHHPDSHRRH